MNKLVFLGYDYTPTWRHNRLTREDTANGRSSHSFSDARPGLQLVYSQMPPLPNPFRRTAGATPPELIGRQGMLDEFEYGLRLGSGAPGLLTIISGARGIGKTALLSAAQEKARQQGWIVIAETATPGFLVRIGETIGVIWRNLAPALPAAELPPWAWPASR
ncbi:ATP-binding protein [Pseudarthrobacter enclensis]|uniref:Orc1-like AAA ATPase domain-containing protein n=1 Tax=Pseudarthrobacter enclensis TaxID=993070 RepID=A0ABT9RU03_9MICC|nr:ATP-binding protein [Pseudarthrobacter enclensis]MDP9888720.1 hypothetical protein [Pseudarthrobacter enclensis]